MVNVAKLRGMMTEQNVSVDDVAKACNESKTTIYRRFNSAIFDTVEIEALCKLLSINDKTSIFFAE